MEFVFSEDLSIQQVKDVFSEEYSLLKIEFFQKGHVEGQPNSKKDLIQGNPLLKEISVNSGSGSLTVGKNITVAELEHAFNSRFGLNIQVFRKSGSVWLETTTTDNLTLAEQNKLAMEKNTPVETTKPGDIDYD